MRLNEPQWWYGDPQDVRGRLLAPLGRIYGWIAQSRFRRHQPYRSRFPVICIGNFTAGGTGKTPLAITTARLLLARGESPVFLTRGYGGTARAPIWVEDGPGAARHFGDEPLLLARVAPTLVSCDRRVGICAIEEAGRKVSAVIMDDGLQNPTVAKDLSIAVVDGRRGLGNGEVIPAGPLRAPIEFQLGLVDAIVVREPEGASPDGRDIHELLRRRFPGPVLAARAVPSGDTSWLAGTPVVAFAGIANPERFYSLAECLGARVVARVSFPDHHHFSRADADRLLGLAQTNKARLLTTEKDWVRIAGDTNAGGELLQKTQTLGIEMAFDERDLGRLVSLIEAAIQQQAYPRAALPPQL